MTTSLAAANAVNATSKKAIRIFQRGVGKNYNAPQTGNKKKQKTGIRKKKKKSMQVWRELIETLQGGLRWEREPEGWPLVSAGSGGAVPWSFCVVELCRLLGAYPSGVTRALLLAELQRRWNDRNHRWGRNLGGRTGAVHLIHLEGSVPHDTILEVRLGESVQQALPVRTVHDMRGGNIEWCLHHKILPHLEAGTVGTGSLIRLTGLKAVPSGTGGLRAISRLLPTDLMTVVVTSRADMSSLRDRIEGCMLAQIVSMNHEADPPGDAQGRPDVAVSVGLEARTEVGKRLVKFVVPSLMAELFKVSDTLLIAEPIVGLGNLVEYGSRTLVFQYPADPLLQNDGDEMEWSSKRKRLKVSADASMPLEDMAHHVGPQYLSSMGACYNATVLVEVIQVKELAEAEVAVLARGYEPGGRQFWIHCHRVCSHDARKLLPGQWIVCSGLIGRMVSKGSSVTLRLDLDDTPSRHHEQGRLMPVPLVGLLASPSLWEPRRLRDAGCVAVAACIMQVAHVRDHHVVAVRLDDGDSIAVAHVSPEVQSAVEAAVVASGMNLSEGLVVGVRWNVWLVIVSGGFRVDACVPAHCMQLCWWLMEDVLLRGPRNNDD